MKGNNNATIQKTEYQHAKENKDPVDSKNNQTHSSTIKEDTSLTNCDQTNAQQNAIHFKEIVSDLATLSDLEYERIRNKEAKNLGVRVRCLDAQVEKQRLENMPTNINALLENDKPWHDEVNGIDLLDIILAKFNRYASLPKGAAFVVVLWLLGTYCFNNFRTWPKLLVISPTHRCGKSTVLEVLFGLCYKSFSTSNITSAALFRVIQAKQPTLIIDEADTFLNNNSDMRGIINSGHSKSSAFVTRVCGNDIQTFSTWTPTVIAMIGNPSDTILDRGIKIEIQRKMSTEYLDKLPLDFIKNCQDLRKQMVRWAEDNQDQLNQVKIVLPHSNNDREIDNWTPIFKIANVIGGKWPELAINAYTMISAPGNNESIGEQLLCDIQKVFTEKHCAKIHSVNLVNELLILDGSPWSEFKGNRAISQKGLAQLLKPFNIKAKQLRISNTNRNGYSVEMFEDAFKRYIPLSIASESSTPTQPSETRKFSEDKKYNNAETEEFSDPLQANDYNTCRVVDAAEPHNYGTVVI